MISSNFLYKLFLSDFTCYIQKNGRINIVSKKDLILTDVHSTKLRTIAKKLQKFLTHIPQNTRASQLEKLCVNLGQLNIKFEKWNKRVDSSCLLRLINRIFFIKIKLLDLTKLEERATNKRNEETAIQTTILDSEQIKKFMADHCESVTGDFKNAKYIFFGDTHSDSHLTYVRTIILNHILNFYPKSTQHVLEEGTPFNYTSMSSTHFYIDPRLIYSKKSSIVVGKIANYIKVTSQFLDLLHMRPMLNRENNYGLSIGKSKSCETRQ